MRADFQAKIIEMSLEEGSEAIEFAFWNAPKIAKTKSDGNDVRDILIAATEQGICALFIAENTSQGRQSAIFELQKTFPKAKIAESDGCEITAASGWLEVARTILRNSPWFSEAVGQNKAAGRAGETKHDGGAGGDGSGAKVSAAKTTKVTLHMRGTAFQMAVWRALREIPRGKTTTYSDIATKIGHPKAVRAVGSAVGANPVSLLVPCHRVVPKTGGAAKPKTGNYRWGALYKKLILENEIN